VRAYLFVGLNTLLALKLVILAPNIIFLQFCPPNLKIRGQTCWEDATCLKKWGQSCYFLKIKGKNCNIS